MAIQILLKTLVLFVFICGVFSTEYSFKDTDGNFVNDSSEYFIKDCIDCNCLSSTLYTTGRYIAYRTCNAEDYDQRWSIVSVTDGTTKGVSLKNYRGSIISSSTNLGGYSYMSDTKMEMLSYGTQTSNNFVQFYTSFGSPFGYAVDSGVYFLYGIKESCGAGCIDFTKKVAFMFVKIK